MGTQAYYKLHSSVWLQWAMTEPTQAFPCRSLKLYRGPSQTLECPPALSGCAQTHRQGMKVAVKLLFQSALDFVSFFFKWCASNVVHTVHMYVYVCTHMYVCLYIFTCMYCMYVYVCVCLVFTLVSHRADKVNSLHVPPVPELRQSFCLLGQLSIHIYWMNASEVTQINCSHL